MKMSVISCQPTTDTKSEERQNQNDHGPHRRRHQTPKRRKVLQNRPSKILKLVTLLLLSLPFLSPTDTNPKILPTAEAFSVQEWIQNEIISPMSSKVDVLSITDISSMRVRDIQRRLTRSHGYTPDEVATMINKQELINALSYEEHKVWQREEERKKRVLFKRSVMVALVCVILVMFRGLFEHVWEVACVNFVVYTDKRRYEFSRCRELKSPKALFGLFLLFLVDCLHFWLTITVILSWIIRHSKYFFPIPRISIQPMQLLATAAGVGGPAGFLGQYGVNVGPMLITWSLRFVTGRVEGWMARALAVSVKRQRKERKAAQREEEKKEEERLRMERKAARRARRAEREARKQRQEKEEKERQENGENDYNDETELQQKHPEEPSSMPNPNPSMTESTNAIPTEVEEDTNTMYSSMDGLD